MIGKIDYKKLSLEALENIARFGQTDHMRVMARRELRRRDRERRSARKAIREIKEAR